MDRDGIVIALPEMYDDGGVSLSLVNISAPIAQPQTKKMCTVTSGSR
jgi:hypothetical protein